MTLSMGGFAIEDLFLKILSETVPVSQILIYVGLCATFLLGFISILNQYIDKMEPWKKIKTDKKDGRKIYMPVPYNMNFDFQKADQDFKGVFAGRNVFSRRSVICPQ